VSLGMNDLMPCGTDAARKRHRAKAQLCLACEPDIERMGWCRSCESRVPAVGELLQPHQVQRREGVAPCPGAGQRVFFPKPVDVPLWVTPQPGRHHRVVALASLPRGAA
jgi:hypothetical protein